MKLSINPLSFKAFSLALKVCKLGEWDNLIISNYLSHILFCFGLWPNLFDFILKLFLVYSPFYWKALVKPSELTIAHNVNDKNFYFPLWTQMPSATTTTSTGKQGGSTAGQMKVYRKRIPDRPNANLNLWSIMKNCIGKELSKIPMPVRTKFSNSQFDLNCLWNNSKVLNNKKLPNFKKS